MNIARRNRQFLRRREIVFVQRIRPEVKEFGREFAVRGGVFQNIENLIFVKDRLILGRVGLGFPERRGYR